MVAFLNYLHLHMQVKYEVNISSCAYLRLLIFLPAVLIPACASSSPVFLMMYSAYKLNKQGDNIQLWRTPFPIWHQSVVPCPVLIVTSWPAYRFLEVLSGEDEHTSFYSAILEKIPKRNMGESFFRPCVSENVFVQPLHWSLVVLEF